MIRKLLLSLIPLAMAGVAAAQITPEIYSWKINTTAATGFAGIPSNVQQVQYSANNVYISCTGIPDYTIGPWPGNPNTAQNQNFVFKITRHPQPNTGTPTAVGLGHTGVFSNGVSIFNADDGMTYNNQGVWHRNAYFWENISFDDCLGHPQQNGEYHHHVSPRCLYDATDSTHHAPIIGYAFDGYPVYGAYGFADTAGTGPVKRMTSSYRLRNITARTTLPNGTTAPSPGPAINATYPLGAYLQDYEFVPGLGTLDARNGRYCVTPEYPGGTYAYFVTIDAALLPVFPYTMSGTYYGIVQPGNTGPGGGHNTINEPVTTYTTTGIRGEEASIPCQVYPVPAAHSVRIFVAPGGPNNVRATLTNGIGQPVKQAVWLQPAVPYTMDVSDLAAGVYLLQLETAAARTVRKISVIHP